MQFPDAWFERKYIEQGRDFEGESRKAALQYVREFYRAIDGGAHCGIWTDKLAREFSHVVAFEPCAENLGFLKANVQRTNVDILPYALGESRSVASLSPGPDSDPNKNSGQWHLSEGSDIEVIPLDAFGYGGVGLIKLDVEGYEYFALLGAEHTIKKCHPVVLIEENGLCRRYGVEPGASGKLLARWGYTLKERIYRDEVWVCE